MIFGFLLKKITLGYSVAKNVSSTRCRYNNHATVPDLRVLDAYTILMVPNANLGMESVWYQYPMPTLSSYRIAIGFHPIEYRSIIIVSASGTAQIFAYRKSQA
jgi:hypothetical protein